MRSYVRAALLVAGLVFAVGALVRNARADNIEYVYDSLNRLVEARYPDRIIYYTYDAAGNRTSVRVVAVNPAPSLTSLEPGGAVAGGGGFVLTVNGSNFVSGAVVRWNGADRPTAFVSAAKLTADIPAADIAAVGAASVSVSNPEPGGGESNALPFPVASPTPTPALKIDGVSPRAGRASGGQQVKLTGSFANLSTVTMGGVSASWSFTDGTSEVTVTTPAHAVGAVSIDLGPASGSTYSKPDAFAYLPTSFTDNTLVAGVTTAKAQHILELRQAVDALRAVAGLPPAPWADPSPAPTSTDIKVIHILELRTYIDDVAARLGYATTPYTDPSLSIGLPVKRIHVEELRQRVRAIAG